MNDYAENPTRYVSQYGANYFHEDIADTFARVRPGRRAEGGHRGGGEGPVLLGGCGHGGLRTALRERLGLVWSESDAPADTSSELPAQAAVADLAQLQAELTRAHRKCRAAAGSAGVLPAESGGPSSHREKFVL